MLIDLNNVGTFIKIIKRDREMTYKQMAEQLNAKYSLFLSWKNGKGIESRTLFRIIEGFEYRLRINKIPVRYDSLGVTLISEIQKIYPGKSLAKVSTEILGMSESFFYLLKKQNSISPLTLQYVCDELGFEIDVQKIGRPSLENS